MLFQPNPADYFTLGPTLVGIRHRGFTAIAADGQISDPAGGILRTRLNCLKLFADQTVIVGWGGAMTDASEALHFWMEFFKHNRVDPEVIQLALADHSRRGFHPTLIGSPEALVGWDGEGNWFEPEDGVIAIGPGAQLARAVGLALVYHSSLTAIELARETLRIVSQHCVWVNNRINVEAIANEDRL